MDKTEKCRICNTPVIIISKTVSPDFTKVICTNPNCKMRGKTVIIKNSP